MPCAESAFGAASTAWVLAPLNPAAEPEPTACPVAPGSASRGGNPKRGSGQGSARSYRVPWADQPSFGIRPYRSMLGALRVRPDVVVRASIPEESL